MSRDSRARNPPRSVAPLRDFFGFHIDARNFFIGSLRVRPVDATTSHASSVDVAKQRATLDRGSKAGVRVADYGGIYPVRGREQDARRTLRARRHIGVTSMATASSS